MSTKPTTGNADLGALRRFLVTLPPGPIEDPQQVAPLLARCWDDLQNSRAEGMAGHKLLGRMEAVSWQPPVLSFEIERHGATVQGSTRAEVQAWSVDVEQAAVLSITAVRRRQVHPMQRRLDVKALAEEVTRLIVASQEDERLRWYEDGSVRVLVGEVIPDGSCVKQTLAGRRARFRYALQSRLGAEGWALVKGPYTYRRKEAP